jgi:methyltransferase (TIGR00027 family)
VTDVSPSRTAAGVAWLRAAHQTLDDPPRILDDPAIVALLGPTAAERLRAEWARAQTPGTRALRAHVVLRSRFAEDRLALAVARGVRQYIVPGAGYDTFIVRQPAWAHDLRIVEVDQPGTQAEKRARLAAAGLDVPDNVVFADVDFEHETLTDGLARHRIALDTPTFFSWLGVTMYLSEPAVDAVLRTVARCPAGSEIVFTFVQPRGRETPSRESHHRGRHWPSVRRAWGSRGSRTSSRSHSRGSCATSGSARWSFSHLERRRRATSRGDRTDCRRLGGRRS